jgi:hypothetical protein
MGGEVIESREEPESEEEERQMEWDTTWEDPLTSYVKQFHGLIGDQRTRKTFGEVVILIRILNGNSKMRETG